MTSGEWPTAADVMRRLGINTTDVGTTEDVQGALNAAIAIVEADCKYKGVPTYDPTVIPDRLAQAAILLAAATYKAPDAPFGVAGIFDTAAVYVAREHPTYEHLVKGFRGDFGIG